MIGVRHDLCLRLHEGNVVCQVLTACGCGWVPVAGGVYVCVRVCVHACVRVSARVCVCVCV